MAIVAIAACAPATAEPTPGPTVVKVTLGEVGLEAASLDRTADPCVDFYQFACGGWLAANPVPEDKARWSRGGENAEKVNKELRAILEEDATKPATPTAKRLGDFYAACMDEASIEKAGLAGWKPLLDKVQIKNARGWLPAIEALHELGDTAVWTTDVYADFKDATTDIVLLDSGGLGLPDRDYYDKPELASKLDAYKQYVAHSLALYDPKLGAAAVDDVIAIEKDLAKVSKTAVEARDIPDAYHPTDLAGLGRQVKSVDWKGYFKAIHLAPSKRIDVAAPKYFAAIDKLHAKYKPAQWAHYFTMRVLELNPLALPKQLDDEAFAFEKALRGTEKQRGRGKRCADATGVALGEELGQEYVAKHFTPEAKAAATQLTDAVAAALGQDIAKLDWMSDATKKTAQAKLAKIVRRIGYPDKWRSYDIKVTRGDFAGDQLRALIFNTHYIYAKAGKPVDRGVWAMAAYEPDAYYDPTMNNIAVPAATLQPPTFGQDRSIAANLGALGLLVGHELTHAFDDQGAQFDGDGNVKNWWTPADKAKFDERAKCVADEYSSFEVLPKLFVNGELTLGEDIADNGGAKLAWMAYKALRKDATKVYVADGFTEDQQFFLGLGQDWCGNFRPAELQRQMTADPHTPHKFRVYGALRNLPEFAETFHCSAGTPMRPAKACSVW
ncbi:MAG TPA: M13 family metallopeptidase [Kofleriaceae bacterium]|jgi:predicted metalloendopeptidase